MDGRGSSGRPPPMRNRSMSMSGSPQRPSLHHQGTHMHGQHHAVQQHAPPAGHEHRRGHRRAGSVQYPPMVPVAMQTPPVPYRRTYQLGPVESPVMTYPHGYQTPPGLQHVHQNVHQHPQHTLVLRSPRLGHSISSVSSVSGMSCMSPMLSASARTPSTPGTASFAPLPSPSLGYHRQGQYRHNRSQSTIVPSPRRPSFSVQSVQSVPVQPVQSVPVQPVQPVQPPAAGRPEPRQRQGHPVLDPPDLAQDVYSPEVYVTVQNSNNTNASSADTTTRSDKYTTPPERSIDGQGNVPLSRATAPAEFRRVGLGFGGTTAGAARPPDASPTRNRATYRKNRPKHLSLPASAFPEVHRDKLREAARQSAAQSLYRAAPGMATPRALAARVVLDSDSDSDTLADFALSPTRKHVKTGSISCTVASKAATKTANTASAGWETSESGTDAESRDTGVFSTARLLRAPRRNEVPYYLKREATETGSPMPVLRGRLHRPANLKLTPKRQIDDPRLRGGYDDRGHYVAGAAFEDRRGTEDDVAVPRVQPVASGSPGADSPVVQPRHRHRPDRFVYSRDGAGRDVVCSCGAVQCHDCLVFVPVGDAHDCTHTSRLR